MTIPLIPDSAPFTAPQRAWLESLGVDAVPGEITELEAAWVERKLRQYGLEAPRGAQGLQKIVAGKRLWNYDNLEPTEKKIIL